MPSLENITIFIFIFFIFYFFPLTNNAKNVLYSCFACIVFMYEVGRECCFFFFLLSFFFKHLHGSGI